MPCPPYGLALEVGVGLNFGFDQDPRGPIVRQSSETVPDFFLQLWHGTSDRISFDTSFGGNLSPFGSVRADRIFLGVADQVELSQ